MFESFNKSCSIYIKVLYKTRKTAALGGVSLVHRGAPHLVAFLLKKKVKTNLGRLRCPKWSYSFRRAMRIPNMCLALKLDNGKVVSMAHKHTQTDRHTQDRISI